MKKRIKEILQAIAELQVKRSQEPDLQKRAWISWSINGLEYELRGLSPKQPETQLTIF